MRGAVSHYAIATRNTRNLTNASATTAALTGRRPNGMAQIVAPSVAPRNHERQQNHTQANVKSIVGKGRRELASRPLRKPVSDRPDRFPRELEHQQRKHLERVFEAEECH